MPHRYKQNPHGKLDLLGLWSLPDNIRDLHKKIQYKAFVLVDSATVSGVIYRLHNTVELRPTNGCEHGDILRINKIKIYDDRSIGVVFAGNIFRRSKDFPVGHQDPTEVILLAHIARYSYSKGSMLRNAEVHVNPRDILSKTAKVVLTNAPLYDTNISETDGSKSLRLACRVVLISYYTEKPLNKTQKPFEWELRRLFTSEVSHKSCGNKESHQVKEKSFREHFTYVSGFSGGGGEVHGAIQARAKILLAFEISREACQTIYRNHQDIMVFNGDQWEVTNGQMSNMLRFGDVDMLHLSSECGFYSPAHTLAGSEDETSSALLFCTAAQLKHFKPLIHTQEQTPGLFKRHPQCFFRLIADIFESGYNVRWSVRDFRDWGLIARRRRLIIIAARYVLVIQ
jgi:C-5 cytosine-specific DNA methylase